MSDESSIKIAAPLDKISLSDIQSNRAWLL